VLGVALQVKLFFTWYGLPHFSCIGCGYGMIMSYYTLYIYLVVVTTGRAVIIQTKMGMKV